MVKGPTNGTSQSPDSAWDWASMRSDLARPVQTRRTTPLTWRSMSRARHWRVGVDPREHLYGLVFNSDHWGVQSLKQLTSSWWPITPANLSPYLRSDPHETCRVRVVRRRDRVAPADGGDDLFEVDQLSTGLCRRGEDDRVPATGTGKTTDDRSMRVVRRVWGFFGRVWGSISSSNERFIF